MRESQGTQQILFGFLNAAALLIILLTAQSMVYGWRPHTGSFIYLAALCIAAYFLEKIWQTERYADIFNGRLLANDVIVFKQGELKGHNLHFVEPKLPAMFGVSFAIFTVLGIFILVTGADPLPAGGIAVFFALLMACVRGGQVAFSNETVKTMQREIVAGKRATSGHQPKEFPDGNRLKLTSLDGNSSTWVTDTPAQRRKIFATYGKAIGVMPANLKNLLLETSTPVAEEPAKPARKRSSRKKKTEISLDKANQ